MTVFSAVVVYVMIFWTVLFAILPWGNRPADTQETGHAGSAPANPRIKQKFLIAAIVSVFLWGVVCAMIHYRVIDLYEVGRQMAEEDYQL